MSAAPQDLAGKFDLTAAPGKPFILLSSEASAAAARRLVTASIAVHCQEAPGAWQWVDLRPLVGRNGVLLPDATPDARADMLKLAERLDALGCKVDLIDLNGQPEDWTLADWTGTKDEFQAWAQKNRKLYVAPPQPTTDAQDEPPQIEEADLQAQAAEPASTPRTRRKPRLATVDGNTALAPETAAAAQAQPLSHDALAEHFVYVNGEDWRYVAQWGKWFEWASDRWREDVTEKPVGLAKQVTRDALKWPEAASITSSDKRKVNSIMTAKALLGFARADRAIAATVEQWDTDPLRLGVPGGVIDLSDGRMLPPERSQYMTKRCAVAPASGKPQLWLKYLDRAHDGVESIIGYLQRYAGYCATGEIKEHALAFLYGTGRNGKGVFLETIRGILGDYARTASMETFIEQRNPAHSTELARLHGARLVVTEEAAQSSRWNEGRVKHMTGGGKITAHYMRQDDFEFTPTFKLLIAANHKPMLRSVDEAIKARIHLVPFNITIPPEERDLNLLSKLEVEWPQILGWILDGCTEWQRIGLAVPGEVLDATEKYIESEDVLGSWLEERCERKDRAEGRTLYDDYRRWCEQQGEHAWSRRAWANTMIERGFEQRKSDGQRLFLGVRLKAASVPPTGHYPG